MNQEEIAEKYNYHSFVWELVEPWLRFGESPKVGSEAPDFPLWMLDGRETRLSEVWSQHRYTMVEFGSYT